MRSVALLLLLVGSQAVAQDYDSVEVFGGPDCVDTGRVRLLTGGVASAHGLDAISTDGFGVRLRDEAPSIGAASILDDAALAWRTPTEANGASIICPGLRPSGASPVNHFGYLYLAAEAGNETGDPGPLRYLDPSLPNVDKIGPDYEATLRIPNRAVVSARWRDFLPTDSSIAPRIFGVLEDRFPKRKGLAIHAAARLTDRVSVIGDGLVAEDLPFEETLGREVPTLRRRAGTRVQARHGWWDGYVVSRTEWLERPSWSRLNVSGPDWRETVTEAGVAGPVHQTQYQQLGDPHGEVEIGARVRHRVASGPGLADGSVLWGEVTADAWRGNGAGSLAASGAVSAGPNGIGGRAKTSVTGSRAVWTNLRLQREASVHASRDLPEADPTLPFWVSRGYSGLVSEVTPLVLDGVPVPVEVAGGTASAALLWSEEPDLFADRQQSASVSAELAAEARRGETALLPSFQLEDAVAVSGPVRATAASGTVTEASLSAQWSRFAPALHGRSPVHTTLTVWTNARLVLGGDDAFYAARDREPAVRLGALAEHSPDGRLNLSARLEWRSNTRWEGWPEPEVPATLLADLGLDYTLGAFTLALTGRNVLGAPEQTHPLGATLDGRLFVRLSARLGG